jgi:hypothetical protein
LFEVDVVLKEEIMEGWLMWYDGKRLMDVVEGCRKGGSVIRLLSTDANVQGVMWVSNNHVKGWHVKAMLKSELRERLQ